MFSFYRQHIPHYAHIVEPLQQLLNETQPKQSYRRKTNCHQLPAPTLFIMLKDHRKAFATLKTALASVTFHHLTENATVSLTTDASDTATGAALHEKTEKSSRPFAFFAERNYCRRKKLRPTFISSHCRRKKLQHI